MFNKCIKSKPSFIQKLQKRIKLGNFDDDIIKSKVLIGLLKLW